MTAELLKKIQCNLEQTVSKQLWRQLVPRTAHDGIYLNHQGKKLINFSSNDYLGLSQHPKVLEQAKQALNQYGFGSGAAQTIGGYTDAHAALEHGLATFLGAPQVRLFSTGYMANLGLITTLIHRHDHVFSDRSNHASILDAILYTGAHHHRYASNSMTRLQDMLATIHHTTHQKWIVSDTVFSMSGHHINYAHMANVGQQHNATLLLDDAHGFGVLGRNGTGIAAHVDWQQDHLGAYTITFGKALGTFGACVVGKSPIIEALTQYARSFLYTTAMPPMMAAATCAALQCVQSEPEHVAALQTNIGHFITICKALNLNIIPSETAIQCLPMPDIKTATQCATHLHNQGFHVQAMRPPTVPKPCMRITLNRLHTPSMIDKLLETLHAQTRI